MAVEERQKRKRPNSIPNNLHLFQTRQKEINIYVGPYKGVFLIQTNNYFQ